MHNSVSHKAGQTKFTVYRHKVFDFACGQAVGYYSDFIPVERARMATLELEIAEAPPPIRVLEGVGR